MVYGTTDIWRAHIACGAEQNKERDVSMTCSISYDKSFLASPYSPKQMLAIVKAILQ
jgi:hypothetical protein